MAITDTDMRRLEELQRLMKNEGGYSACSLAEAIHWAKVGPRLLTALDRLVPAIATHRHWFDTCTRTLAENWERQAGDASDEMEDSLAIARDAIARAKGAQ